MISRLVIDNDDVDPQTPEVVLPIPHLKNVKGLAYDPVDHYIYWIEGKQNNIKRSTDNGTNVSIYRCSLIQLSSADQKKREKREIHTNRIMINKRQLLNISYKRTRNVK